MRYDSWRGAEPCSCASDLVLADSCIMKRFLLLLYFLELVPEKADSWGMLPAPLQFITGFGGFLQWNPLKLPMFDVLILAIAVLAGDRAKSRRAHQMEKAIWVSLAALLMWVVWGVAMGGDTYQMQFQLHMIILPYAVTFAIAKVLTTPADFYALGKVILAAAVYRAVTCIVYFVNAVALKGGPLPACCTSHSDSVLFVLGLVILVVHAIHQHSTIRRSSMVKMVVSFVLILLGIQFNNRRLAWVSLVECLILIYVLLPSGLLKKRINKKLIVAAPILALYVIVGMGRSEKIFLPLQALTSVKSESDNSTKSRDNENAGLITTLAVNPVMGVGWGQKYNEIDASLSAGVSGFVQYRYLPHNSVLALLAFTGALGFAAIWSVFPMAVFLNAYAYRKSHQSAVRTVALVGMAAVLAVVNQWYGDLGSTFELPGLVVASAFAAAIRLPSCADDSAVTVKENKRVRAPSALSRSSGQRAPRTAS